MATPDQKKQLADALRSRGLDVPSITDQEAADQNAHLDALHQQELDIANLGAMPDATPPAAPAAVATWGAAPAAPSEAAERYTKSLETGDKGAATRYVKNLETGDKGAEARYVQSLTPGSAPEANAATAAAPTEGEPVFKSADKGPPSVIDFPNMAAPAGGGGRAAFVAQMSPETREKFDKAFAAKEAANLTDFNVAQQNYDTMGGLFKNHQLQSRVQGMIDKGQEDHLRGQIDADRMAADNAADEVRNMKEDPNHFWHTKNLGEKALLILGQGLSDAGAALLGHPELIGKQVNAMIEQDLAAQRANIENSRHSLADQRGALAERYRQLGDMRAAHAAARQDMANELGMQLQEAAQKTGSNTAIARAQQAHADILMQQAEVAAKGEKATTVGGAGVAGTKQMEANMKMFDSFMKGAVPETSTASLPGGERVAFPDDQSGQRTKAAQQMIAAYQNFNDLVNEALEVRKSAGIAAVTPGTAANAKLGQITSKLIMAQTAIASEEGGSKVRLSGPEIDFLKDATANAASPMPATDAALKHAQSMTYNGLQASLQSLGARPVQTHMIRNPWGQVVPYTTYQNANPYGPGTPLPIENGNSKGYTVKPPTVKE